MNNIAPVVWLNGASPNAQGRFGFYNVGFTPQIYCDAALIGSYSYDAQLNAYNSRHNVASPLTVEFLANSYSGNNACIRVKVTLAENIAEGNVVYIVLWEDKVAIGHTWRFMQRSMNAPYDVLLITTGGQTQTFSKSFTLDAGWNRANLGCSVYVQKFSNKAMLNAAATKLVEGNAVSPASLGRVKTMFR